MGRETASLIGSAWSEPALGGELEKRRRLANAAATAAATALQSPPNPFHCCLDPHPTPLALPLSLHFPTTCTPSILLTSIPLFCQPNCIFLPWLLYNQPHDDSNVEFTIPQPVQYLTAKCFVWRLCPTFTLPHPTFLPTLSSSDTPRLRPRAFLISSPSDDIYHQRFDHLSIQLLYLQFRTLALHTIRFLFPTPGTWPPPRPSILVESKHLVAVPTQSHSV